jgi:manganese efflux pump family protein
MRGFTLSAAGALGAALVCAVLWLGAGQASASTPPRAPAAAPTASTGACYEFAVSALRRHVVVAHTPPECAGLGAAQVDQVVSRAIREVAGPLPKVAARRMDLAESRYLASLIRSARPPAAASVAAAPATTPGTEAAQVAALVAWLAAALAGGYLLIGGRRPRRPRSVRALGLAGGHAGIAATGLCLWIAFMVTAAPALGWIDVALTWVIAGLGMSTLLGGPAGPAAAVPAATAATAGSAAADVPVPARTPVLMIALHGTLATLTIVLVLLAVIGTG